MYVALALVFLVVAGLLLRRGARTRQAGSIWLGALVVAVMAGFFGLMTFWGEMLWFDAVGFSERFWTVVSAKAGIAVVAALVAAAAVFAITAPLSRRRRPADYWAEGLAVVVGAAWGIASWQVVLRWLNRVDYGTADPILGIDAGFYLFTLPFLDALSLLALPLAVLIVLRLAAATLRVTDEGGIDLVPGWKESSSNTPTTFYVGVGILLLTFAAGRLLDVFHLMYSSAGTVTGPGWTDVHVRLPVLVVLSVIIAAGGLAMLLPPTRRTLDKRFGGGYFEKRFGLAAGVAGPSAALLGLWLIMAGIAPSIVQWLHVEPNEITVERPYIEHNIRFTRLGFDLDAAEDRQFNAEGGFNASTINRNRRVLEEVRLWDWRALNSVYDQFQEIRLYYEFPDVDIDRYHVNGDYRQVMVAAREMEQENLPAGSDTFVNKRFKYTHGYGITLTAVNEFTEEGLPNLLVKDIPPVAGPDSLKVERPEIYYGQLTEPPVVVNTKEAEFDYPSGDENRYARYQGDGGVQMTNLWRKFIYGWKFDGTQFFLSSYPTSESRVMFRRQIRERVQALAPFLEFDEDPYVVLSEGRLYWIVDGYTTSRYFPYSERYDSRETIEYRNGNQPQSLTQSTVPSLHGSNYVRNAVKAVVSAYDGSVDFYVFEPDDPLIQAWSGAFPEMFEPRESLPEELERHVRYPHDYLLTQGLMYAKYHMTDPAVFYNQEDLWIRATEKYRNGIRPVEPYYVMWSPPGSKDAELTAILPFTPKNRQVLVGWIAGLCDGQNYGRFLVYKFPKEQRILGPQQMETKIDQDSYLSERLTLWDQRGSNVIRGNVLAIPLDETLLYVEPIYLQAETAAYPELRLVAVMHKDRLSYAPTFDEALRELAGLGSGPRTLEGVAQAAVSRPDGGKATDQELIRNAQRAFDRYLASQGDGRFADAAQALEDLQAALHRLDSRSTED